MNRFVVDASVAMKWFVPEIHTEHALKLLRDETALLAPDLLFPEFGNILWKKTRRGELSDKESREILTALKVVPLHSYALATLLDPAYEIAHALGCTVYDSTYVALAIAESCPLITADRKLVHLLAQTPLAPTTVWIEDLA